MADSISSLASGYQVVRLTTADVPLARRTFAMMVAVFDEAGLESESLSDAYVARLLARESFWALAALRGDEVVGGLTAHELPMTRTMSSEMFLYDLAVRADHQRRGVGRQLVDHLRRSASEAGISVMFVPADNEDEHALDFYRAIGGEGAAVTIFSFDGAGETRG